MTICRKMQIIPVGDKEEVNRVYKYIRNGMEVESIMANQYMTALYNFCVVHKLKNIKFVKKEGLSEELKELNRLYGRVPNGKKGDDYSFYDFPIEKYPVGLPAAGSIPNNYKPKFQKACDDGLMYGKVSLPTFKMTNPLSIHVDFVKPMIFSGKKNGMYHNYESHMDLIDALMKGKPDIFIKFANNITFKVVFGEHRKSREQRCVFQQIFEENYLVQGSSISYEKTKSQVERSKNKNKYSENQSRSEEDKRKYKEVLMLNLSISIPKQKRELDENVTVGVDVGTATPAVCGLNNNYYKRLYLGNKDKLLATRTSIQAQRRRVSRSLTLNAGGHGRNKKMEKLDKLEKHERNFVNKYNHKISHEIIKFALENNAKYINIEDLSGYDANQFILRNWSYYELQQQIIYKAAKFGIEVRKINSHYTSQVCSCCGEWREGNREKQAEFVCKNPGCKRYLKTVNADWNASRNIAKSVLFITDKKSKNVSKEEYEYSQRIEAKKYYKIPLTESELQKEQEKESPKAKGKKNKTKTA